MGLMRSRLAESRAELEAIEAERSEEVSLTKKLVDNYWETAERSAKDMHVMIQVRNPKP